MRDVSLLLCNLALVASLTACAARPAPLTLAEWDCTAQGSGAVRWQASRDELLVARRMAAPKSGTELLHVSESGQLLSRSVLDIAARPVAFLDDEHLFFADDSLSLVSSSGGVVASWPLAREPALVATNLLLARSGAFFAELSAGCEALGVAGCRAGAGNLLSAGPTGHLTMARFGIEPPVAWRLLQNGIAARDRRPRTAPPGILTDSASAPDGSVLLTGSYEQGLALAGFEAPAQAGRGFFVARWHGDGSPAWLRDFPLKPTTSVRIQRVAVSGSEDVVVTGSLERGRLSVANHELSPNDGGGFALDLSADGHERSVIGLQLGAHTLADPIDSDTKRLIVRRELSDPSGYCRARVERYAW